MRCSEEGIRLREIVLLFCVAIEVIPVGVLRRGEFGMPSCHIAAVADGAHAVNAHHGLGGRRLALRKEIRSPRSRPISD